MEKQDLLAEIRRLRTMSVSELQVRHAEVFGDAYRSRNRDFLWRRIAWRLQELAEGGLPERIKEQAIQRACDADLRVIPLKDARGIPVPELLAQTPPDPRMPTVGTTLRRDFGGITHEVKTLQDGFEYNGQKFKSLSAVAREITGTRWNGLVFFKVAAPKTAKGV